MSASIRWPKVLSWSIAGASILIGVLAPVTVLLGWSDADLGDDLTGIIGTAMFLLVGPVYGTVGAAIVSTQPRNSIGWVMVFVCTGMTASVLAEVLVPVERPDFVSVPLAIFLVLGSLAWVFFIFPIFHLMLTFPTGRPLSKGWTPFLVLELASASYVLLTGLFAESVSALDDAWTVANPIGFISDFWDSPLMSNAFQWSLLVLLGAGLVSMGLRFRRASSIERQQLRGLVFAVGFFASVYTVLALISGGEDSRLVDLLLPMSLVGVGVAVGLAVLRYRLYDIDRFISRTVTYAVVVGLLASIVAVVATLVGTRFDDPPVVAAITLGVAALFTPLRRRVQNFVDRRFNRSKYDAERVMDEFALSLRDETDVGEIVDGWVQVVATTMQPATVGVWLR